jgi:hypothetical protein
MIKLESISNENKKTSFITFSNELGKRVSIPVPKDMADLISKHLRLLSTEPPEKVERAVEENSD